jgi:hypothetical protein
MKYGVVRENWKGVNMRKSFRVIGVSTVFLFLGIIVPANARQEKQGKQEQGARPQEQQQQKPQQQARAPQKPQQKPQQQARAPQQQPQKPQQQARAPQRPQQKPQQQAKAPQQQQRQTQTASSQRPQRTQQAMATQRAQPSLRLSARGSGRIPDERFRSNFGRGHEFHMGNPVMVGGYSRFQYGGYWFGFVQPWPIGWYYTDNVYIDYVDGGYYMFDPYYPGARFAISVVLWHPAGKLHDYHPGATWKRTKTKRKTPGWETLLSMDGFQ